MFVLMFPVICHAEVSAESMQLIARDQSREHCAMVHDSLNRKKISNTVLKYLSVELMTSITMHTHRSRMEVLSIFLKNPFHHSVSWQITNLIDFITAVERNVA